MVEDMARPYEKSLKLSDLTSATVHKDTWYLLQDGSKVKRDLGRSAYKAMGIVFDLEQKLSKIWDDCIGQREIGH